jgi:hypothetical protein
MSLALSYTIVGIIISRIMTVINLITYIIKISKQLMMYSGDSFSGAALSAMLFHLLISVTVSGMTMQGLLDIKIHDIKRIRRNYK